MHRSRTRTLLNIFSLSQLPTNCFVVSRLCTSSHLCLLKQYGGSSSDKASAELTNKFKDVMRSVPSPVVVVTSSQTNGPECQKRGVTCSSFTSVSMQPPIVSLCIKRPSRMHTLLTQNKRFAVNVLAEDQVHYSVHFSTPAKDGEDQFSAIPYKLGIADIPLIEGSAAVLQCQAYDVHTLGDHHVWYGEVVDAEMDNTHGNQPLLYFAKSYRSVGDETFMKAFEDTTLLFEDWSHEAHLRMSWNYIRKYDKEAAIPIIRNGILKYNEQNKEKIARGYHETVTIFYIEQVAHAIKQCEDLDTTFEEFLAINKHLTDKALLYQYYSEDLINSPAARFRYQPPDLKKLPV